MEKEYEKLGDYHKVVTVKCEEGQIWIDRAFQYIFGYCHLQAINCFSKALETDPQCAIAHWGIAFCYGPHYNLILYPKNEYSLALKHLEEASRNLNSLLDWERDLIEATRFRYPNVFPENERILETLGLFKDKLKAVYEKYPSDLDIAAFYAESIMNLRPWQLWKKNGEPYPEALEAKAVLEAAVKLGHHTLIYHLFIHLFELSPLVKEALPIADNLLNISNGIGHLLHMPSHIYIQVGNYKKALFSNQLGIEADKLVAKRIGIFNFYTFYRLHNYHFLIWTAMFLGDYDTAITNSFYLKNEISNELVAYDGNNMEFFYSMYLHVYERFGKWDEILNDPIETREAFYIARTMQRFSRCIAFGVKGMINEAEEELKKFYELKELNPIRRIGNNDAGSVFKVAEEFALGEIQYRKGNYEEAYEHLRESVKLNDELIYAEPWDWPQPTRHALGALLLEQGYAEEAESVYKKDLETYPSNIWSLTGYYESLIKLNKNEEAKIIEKELEVAKSNTQQSIKVSCFCRIKN